MVSGMKKQAKAIYWLRNDLRLSDNPALVEAAKEHQVTFAYVHAPEDEGSWASGAASNWWLHHSLDSLDQSIREKYDTHLVILTGAAHKVLPELVESTNSQAVFFSKRYEPWGRAQEVEVTDLLDRAEVQVYAFDSFCLFAPESVTTAAGQPYKVFTPYWRRIFELSAKPAQPLRTPTKLDCQKRVPAGVKLEDLNLLPKIDWAGGIEAAWSPGEAGAQANLKKFLHGRVDQYSLGRDRPAKLCVSRLSPHLHFGEISPRAVWHAVDQHCAAHAASTADCEQYMKELGWREFAIHLLYHFPYTQEKPLRKDFERFPWLHDIELLQAWQRGMTGFPIVDAGMRELWTTGWMHNRVRMVVASFLVKDLRIAWQEGARWFWDTLVDADLANNTLGWQWTAGCGADAAPYFRIFNPALQGQRFDPEGEYVRKWVPELKDLPNKWIHRPWSAPPLILQKANVEIGKSYPAPIVDHSTARKYALTALESITGKG